MPRVVWLALLSLCLVAACTGPGPATSTPSATTGAITAASPSATSAPAGVAAAPSASPESSPPAVAPPNPEATTAGANPGTPLATATPQPKVVALDPGHGGPESGSVGVAPSGEPLAEKDVNLQIARKLRDRLTAAGIRVVLTRDCDCAADPEYKGGGYQGGVNRDLQARVNIANEAKADLFLSIHNNGSANASVSGTEVWYNRDRPFADRNLVFATLVHDDLLAAIRGLGHSVVDRGIRDDSEFRIFRGQAFNLYVLGPGTGSRPHPATQMPSALGESLFLTNPREVALLSQERTLDAIAEGYAQAILEYFRRYG